VIDPLRYTAANSHARVPTPIKDYFLIGDLQTAALVSKNGSIDWLCLPYFDSPSVFAALIDAEKGGMFRLDMEGFAATARYTPYTAIVETTFAGEGGAFTVKDFMLPRPTEEVVPHYLIRKITGKQGNRAVRFVFDPRPNYARQRAIIQVEGSTCSIRIEDRTLWLHLPKDARITPHSARGGLNIEIDVAEGETKQIVLEYTIASRLKLQDRDWETETAEFWKNWITQGNFEFSREHLVRSAITIKLMQFYPTGGLIAAPTTSLPEELGGVRNWDYRYVWVRDATFSLYAFFVLGFKEEAKKFFRFMESIAEEAKRCEGEDCELDLGVMYTIWGQPLQGEAVLGHLSGYGGSVPVRIGNGAAEQFQLDAYGSLIDAYYFMCKRGLPISDAGKDVIKMLVRAIETDWQRMDSGIWEVRGGDKHFAYSKMMAWLGVDRAIKLKDVLGASDAMIDKWTKLKDTIAGWIWKNCYDEERGTFTQHPDTKAQDATNFLFILLFFLSRHDEKAIKVIEETRKELCTGDLFVYRYLNDDGLMGGEGAFLLCSFWQIAALAAVGKTDEAEALLKRFESMMPISGLIAEELDPKTGEYLGNHPQAFSHIGYILSAYYIHRYRSKS
jgi:GH15 family glucan-1,4-alpha-glucosidase